MKRFAAATFLALVGLLTAAAAAWGFLALAYAGPGNDAVRNDVTAAFAAISIAAVGAIFVRSWRWPVLAVFAVAFGAVMVRHLAIEPSNDRNWQPDVAVLPHATIEGDLVTVHNIRNFDYRSETDFTPAYYDKTFDINTLDGVDLIAVYWMGPAIAHTFVSFSFAGGDHLAVSIETRKEQKEAYSTLKGFFRQYELFYVVADERDVIRLRTNYRLAPPEDVYVYRMHGPIENGRRMFLEYVKQINSLRDRPEFYNTLASNCTVGIWYNTLVNAEHLPLSWKILLSGYVPEYLYESGRLDTSVNFEELRRRSHVNARARAADADPDFSRLIRLEAGSPPAEGGGHGSPASAQPRHDEGEQQADASGQSGRSPAR